MRLGTSHNAGKADKMSQNVTNSSLFTHPVNNFKHDCGRTKSSGKGFKFRKSVTQRETPNDHCKENLERGRRVEGEEGQKSTAVFWQSQSQIQIRHRSRSILKPTQVLDEVWE